MGAQANPHVVHTTADLACQMDALRAGRSYGQLDRSARRLPPAGGRALPSSTVSDWLTGKSVPSVDALVTFLIVCGVDEQAHKPWLEALDRVTSGHLRRPSGSVRVREARPRLLGVHAAIHVEGAGESLPVYVPRDFDADLRTAVTAAATQGGLVLLVGGSFVGKTRALFEAIRAAAPDWWLVHPDPADVDALKRLVAQPTPRTVVWLDELQLYLDVSGGLPAALIRSLIAAGVALLATLWPLELTVRAGAPAPGRPDPYANDRHLLGLAHIIDVPDNFSRAERRRAEALAADRRIRIALDTPDAGFTQILAAGPDLVRYWENAPAEHCYGKAVLTAALDARRVGATAAVSRAFLQAAAPCYLTDRERATAPADWLDRALAYATTPLRGATAALCPVAAGMGGIAGYTTADYLHQHTRQLRRSVPLPDQAWQALVDHHNPDDRSRLADSAERRGRLKHAETLYRWAASAGNDNAVFWLVNILTKQGRVSEAIPMLHSLVEAGNDVAADHLVDVFVAQGRIDDAVTVLRAKAEAGDEAAPDHIADLLIDDDRTEDAIDILRALTEAGNEFASDPLADLYAGLGRFTEAVVILLAQGRAGSQSAPGWMAELYAEFGRVDEAIEMLRAFATAGNESAAAWLVNLLADRGRLDELRVQADAGDEFAAGRLAEIYAQLGRADEAIKVLTAHVDAGSAYAASRLADLYAKQGRTEEAIVLLRSYANTGDGYAAYRLVDLLTSEGRVDELAARANAGDKSAEARLVDLLADQGLLEQLRARADAGDGSAAGRLAELYADQGRMDDAIATLRSHARTGNPYTGSRLADLLEKQGAIDELRTRAEAGDEHAAGRLADFYVKHGRIQDAITVLRARADAGDSYAAGELAELYTQQSRIDDAIAILRTHADTGDSYAARQLIDILVTHDRLDDIEAEVHAGTPGAIDHHRSPAGTGAIVLEMGANSTISAAPLTNAPPNAPS